MWVISLVDARAADAARVLFLGVGTGLTAADGIVAHGATHRPQQRRRRACVVAEELADIGRVARADSDRLVCLCLCLCLPSSEYDAQDESWGPEEVC